MDEMMYQQPMMPQMPIGRFNEESGAIAHMRWRDDDLIAYVEEMLGGYKEYVDVDGKLKRIKNDSRAIVNDEGLNEITTFLKAHLNTAIVLSNIEEKKANILIKIQLVEFAKLLTYNQERFEIKKGDLELVQSLIRPIVFSQIYRAVGGHESKNYRTQSFEQNVQQHSTMQNQQPGLFSFARRGK
jgi:hypothetical protein